MPVVFNLSSWAVKRQDLAEWLIEELNTKYQVPRKLGQSWIDSDQVLPLLDGLDEVAKEYRTACVEAINGYRQEHGLVATVVCSRSTEYLALITRMSLRCAVIVQPLTAQQIDDYLSSAGGHLAEVRVAVGKDKELQELAATPLMLSVLTLAYQEKTVEDLLAAGSYETQRTQVFATYVQRMLKRRSADTRYTRQQTMHWLKWLASEMVRHNQTEFYIERMQPDWFPDTLSLRLYHSILAGLLGGLFGGLFVGVILGPSLGLFGLLVGIFYLVA